MAQSQLQFQTPWVTYEYLFFHFHKTTFHDSDYRQSKACAFDANIGLFCVGGKRNYQKWVERSLDYGVTFEELAEHPTGMAKGSLVIVDQDTLFLSSGECEYGSPQLMIKMKHIHLQGDTSGCYLGSVDMKTKVAF